MTPIVGIKITIGGLAGTGKGTISKLLAEQLGYDLNSAGNYFREIAKREGMTNRELEERAVLYQQYDLETDKRTASYGRTNDCFIFEGRIAWHCIPNSVKILLVCNESERWKRVADRDGISLDEARGLTMHREESARKRYRVLYGIEDITDESHYDLVVDTGETDIDGSVAAIMEYLSGM